MNRDWSGNTDPRMHMTLKRDHTKTIRLLDRLATLPGGLVNCIYTHDQNS